MSTTDTISNQRESYRCPVADSRQNCILQVGEEQYSGRLMDESASGFSVLLEKKPHLEIKQTAQLQTDGGCFNVRVMYLAEASPPIGSRLSDTEVPTQWFRLGLSRIGDALPPEEPKAPALDWSFGLRTRDRPRPRSGFPVSGIFLTFAAVVLPLVLIGIFWHTRQEKNDAPVRVKDPWTSWGNEKWSKPDRPKNTNPFFNPLTGEESSPFDSPGEGFGGVNAADSKNETRVQGLIRRLPGPTALVLPEVVKRLNLTDEQQERIRQLADTMAEEIQKLFRDPQLRGARGEIADHRETLHEEYLRRALDLLTPEQRTEFDKLHNQSAAK